MKLKVKLTLDDYRKWNFDFFYGGTRWVIIIFSFLIFFLFWGVFVFDAAQGKYPLSTSLIILAIIVMCSIILFPTRLYFKTKSCFESDKLLQEEQNYEIDENGIKASSNNGNSDIQWDKIYGVNLYKTYITIALARNRMFLLPARFFKDKAEMQELADLLKKVLPKGRVKGKL